MPAPAVETEPKIRAHGPIRVSLSAKVAYNPDLLKRSIGSLMEQLGCPKCFSGADCLFTVERDYAVNPQGVLSAVALNPQPLPPRVSAHAATASLTRGIRYDIDKVFKAVDQVITNLGLCPCHSGFDVLYQNELPVIAVNEQGAQRFGG